MIVKFKITIFLLSTFIWLNNNAQTYTSAFDKIESVNGVDGASYLVNTGSHLLQISEPSYLTSYLDMYLSTKDKRYLDKFIVHVKRVQDRRDDDASYYTNEIPNGTGYSNLSNVSNDFTSYTWSTDEEWGGCSDGKGWFSRVLYTGVLTYPMAKFIYIMKTDANAMALLNESLPTEVYQSVRTGANCPMLISTYNDFVTWLQCRVNQSIQYHDGNWCPISGAYNMLRNTSNPCDLSFKLIWGNLPDRCIIHNEVDVLNMQCAMGRTLIMMKLVESLPGGNPVLVADYYNKAHSIGNNIKQQMSPNNGTYTWCHNYSCQFIEDINHANLIMGFADLYVTYNIDNNLTTNDMEMYARTFTEKFYEKPLQAHENTFGTNGSGTGANQGLNNNNYPNAAHLMGNYGFMTKYTPYIYSIISDLFCGGATGSMPLTEYDPLSAMNAYASLSLYHKDFNPIAVMRNNVLNKQWSGATGGDFDGDGKQEFVTHNKSNGLLEIYSLNPNSTITSIASNNFGGNQIVDVGAGELYTAHPGDEILSINSTGLIILYGANFFPVASYQLPSYVAAPFVGIEVGDVLTNLPGNEIIATTASGYPLIFQYDQIGGVLNWINNVTSNSLPNVSGLTVGDFDPTHPGDEYCYANNTSEVIQMYYMNGFIETPIANYYTTSLPQWKVMTSGDYDGDGIDEIMMTNAIDGKVTMLKLKNNLLVEVSNEYFMPDQLISASASFKKGSKDVLALLRDYDGQITIFDVEGLCPGLNLTNQTINSSTSIDNNFTGAQNNYPIDYHASNVLAVSNFNITDNGTQVTFTAGKEIAITDEFGSDSGTELEAYIDNGLVCNQSVFRTSNLSQKTTEPTDYKEKKILNNVLTLVPNPTENRTQVVYNADLATAIKLTVLDIKGSVLYNQELESEKGSNYFELNLDGYQSGIYFVSILNKKDNSQKVEKLILIK